MDEIHVELSDNKARVLVVGIGGCGNNALTRMQEYGVEGVELIALNTDIQDLNKCQCHKKIQIGEKLTKGLGAGSVPETGEKAAEESQDAIEEAIKEADMVILTCGMGGGTGTGATPFVASIAKGMDKLTVAIVTKPFKYEGKPRMQHALDGIEKLKSSVDTMIVVPNDRLLTIVDKNISFTDGLRKADDEVLLKAVVGVTELIYRTQVINLDFADVKTAMTNKGLAHIGIGIGRGDNKAKEAVAAAVENPLLETSVEGASDLLVHIQGDCTFNEVTEASDYLESLVGSNAKMYFGFDDRVDQPGEMKVTIIATGITQMAQDKRIVPNNKPISPFSTTTIGMSSLSNGNPIERFKRPSSFTSSAYNNSGFGNGNVATESNAQHYGYVDDSGNHNHLSDNTVQRRSIDIPSFLQSRDREDTEE